MMFPLLCQSCCMLYSVLGVVFILWSSHFYVSGEEIPVMELEPPRKSKKRKAAEAEEETKRQEVCNFCSLQCRGDIEGLFYIVYMHNVVEVQI